MLPSAIPQHPVETTDKSFHELGLSEAIVGVVTKIGFEHPTPIQAAVIPTALAGDAEVVRLGLPVTADPKVSENLNPV